MSVLTPAMPLLQRDLHTSAAGAAWGLTAMMLSAAVSTPVVGRLGDLYGPRRVLLVVLGVATAGTVLAAIAPSLGALLAGRALAGVGGGVFPLAYTVIRNVLPAGRTAAAVGLMSSMLGLGGALSWCVAGPVIDLLGWRWLLWMPVVGLVPGLVLAWRLVPHVPGHPGAGVDWWGAGLFSAWMVAALTAITQGMSWGWTSAGVLGLAGAAVALAAVWWIVERRVDEPLVDPRLMRVRGVWTANAASLLAGYGLMAGGVLFPLLVQAPRPTGFGGSATAAAMLQLPASIGMTVAGIAAGRLHHRVGSRAVLMAGAALTGAGYVVVALAHDAMWELYLGGTARGIGLGLAYAAVANLVVAAVEPAQTGVATGVNTLLRTVGGSLGTQVSAVILTASTVHGHPAGSGYTTGFIVTALSMAGVLALALAAPRTRAGTRTGAQTAGRPGGTRPPGRPTQVSPPGLRRVPGGPGSS
ncbi:MFS transporter [Actinomadura harenae]|uniref:MFS transporter n=2 Tax=Actinomadura harenae TaxID=2483351 RepID=A0A3M2LQ65_9ACTN|nr:MFS transporter [Actinomadura harenae]